MKVINAIVTANPADPSLEGKRVIIKISDDWYEKMNAEFQAEISDIPKETVQKPRPHIQTKGSLKKRSQRQIRKNKRRAQR